MSTSRRIVALLDHRLARRLIISPAVALLALLGLLLSPVLFIGAFLFDAVQKRRRWPRVRLLALILGALIIETIAMLGAFVTWIITGFGHLGSERSRWHAHRFLMGRYTNVMLALVTRVIGSRVTWNDDADLAAGPVVLVARHTSFFDALIPATVLSRREKLLAHHVVTHGLRYSPCIDIVGHRFPNRFIRRSPGEGSIELTHIGEIGSLLDAKSAAIIFPEGTFRTEERFERALRRMRRRTRELAERAETLVHVLPPRSNGTYALVQGAPTADVVFCVNTGFESFGSIRSIVDAPYTDSRIVVHTWRVARAEIPEDPDGFNAWLLDQYVEMDRWVESQQS